LEVWSKAPKAKQNTQNIKAISLNFDGKIDPSVDFAGNKTKIVQNCTKTHHGAWPMVR